MLIRTSILDAMNEVHTFKVEQHIGLIVLEHLRHKFYVHILDIDLLQILIQHHNRLIEFLLDVQ